MNPQIYHNYLPKYIIPLHTKIYHNSLQKVNNVSNNIPIQRFTKDFILTS